MDDLDPDARLLGFKLGLGDLNHHNPCRGYSAGCECAECVKRSENVSPAFRAWLEADPDVEDLIPRVWRQRPTPAQPWQARRGRMTDRVVFLARIPEPASAVDGRHRDPVGRPTRAKACECPGVRVVCEDTCQRCGRLSAELIDATWDAAA